MQTMKTITFDFFFAYSQGGQFHEANQITVVEPSYNRRDVYRRMKGYLGEAYKQLSKFTAELRAQPKAATDAANDDEAHVAKKAEDPEKADPNGQDVLEMMRLWLGVEGYVEFCDYVNAKLTGDRLLCFIGTDTTDEKDRIAVQPQHWEEIAKKGGMDAIDNVMALFISFFDARASAPSVTKTTAKTSGSTPSLPAAPSPPARSRLKTQS